MATRLNKKIIEKAKASEAKITFSFISGNRNIVKVDGETFLRVRPMTFHRDMKDAGFRMVGDNNRWYEKV